MRFIQTTAIGVVIFLLAPASAQTIKSTGDTANDKPKTLSVKPVSSKAKDLAPTFQNPCNGIDNDPDCKKKKLFSID